MSDQDSHKDPSQDSLRDIDLILERWSERESEFVEEQERVRAERERLVADFEDLSRLVIKPAMESIIQRLRKDGGDGVIQEGQSGVAHGPRLTLWMSLKGQIAGLPRQDLNPYLQLDLDVEHLQVDVWEGDMWGKRGTCRRTSPWTLEEISSESVIDRAVAILSRATDHGSAS